MIKERISIDKDGLDQLLEMYMYHMLVFLGRDVSTERILQICAESDIDVDEQILLTNLGFAQTLYDINEEEGFNDERFPNRKRTAE